MPNVTIYDPNYPGPITPVCKVGQNLGVYSQGAYRFFRVLYIEGIPASRQVTQDIGAVSANSNSSATQMTVVDAPEGSLIHCRMKPLDDAEFEVSQVRGTGRFMTFTQRSRINISAGGDDPYWALTTAFVLGNDRSLYITAYNQTDYALALSRLQFWGYRYIIDRLHKSQERFLQFLTQNRLEELPDEEKAPFIRGGLTATVVPAEGREA